MPGDRPGLDAVLPPSRPDPLWVSTEVVASGGPGVPVVRPSLRQGWRDGQVRLFLGLRGCERVSGGRGGRRKGQDRAGSLGPENASPSRAKESKRSVIQPQLRESRRYTKLVRNRPRERKFALLVVQTSVVGERKACSKDEFRSLSVLLR